MQRVSFSIPPDHDIVGLEITVDIADRVKLFQEGDDLKTYLYRCLHGQLLVPLDIGRQAGLEPCEDEEFVLNLHALVV